MAGKFKYIKKAIITISKGPRKGQKELRYFYKGDRLSKAAAKKATSNYPKKRAARPKSQFSKQLTIIDKILKKRGMM